MTERVEQPTDAAKVGWRTNPSGETITEPNASKRADGYVYKELVPFDELNWEMKLWGDLHLWLQAFVPREWLDLKQAIDAHAHPERFVVTRDGPGANGARGSEIFAEDSKSSYAPIIIVTDGRRIYYIDSDVAVQGINVVAWDPEDGSQLWTQAAQTFLTGLTCDGDRVYTADTGHAGIRTRNVSTGVTIATGGTVVGALHLVTNGAYLLGADGNNFHYFDISGTTPSETGSTAYGAQVNALAIDSVRAFVGGASGTGLVRAYTLSTRALDWTFNPQTTPDPNIYALVCDGDYVYVGTSRELRNAPMSTNANLWILDRINGGLIAAFDVGNNQDDIRRLTVDDRYLYATLENSSGGLHTEIHTFDLRAGFHSHFSGTTVIESTMRSIENERISADEIAYCCDGVGMIGVDLVPANKQIMRRLFHNVPRTFQRAQGNDIDRRPFFNLAIPIDGR